MIWNLIETIGAKSLMLLTTLLKRKTRLIGSSFKSKSNYGKIKAGSWKLRTRSFWPKLKAHGSSATRASCLELLVVYENTITYQPKFIFYGIGERSVHKNIFIEMEKTITRTVKSAK
jgi:hypothetical protein